ncbi:MAG: hypothetical protein ACLR4N_02845 [Mediterraneibacter faecis]
MIIKSMLGVNRIGDQLLHEIKAKNMTDERIHAFMKAGNWIDYQKVFTKRFELSRQLSLEEALGRAEIERRVIFMMD